MDSSVSRKDEILFLRSCHHISSGLYNSWGASLCSLFFSQLDISFFLLNRNTIHTTMLSDIFKLFLSQLLENVTTQGCRDFLKIRVHAVKTYMPKGRRGIVSLVLNHSTRWKWDYLRENLRYPMSEPQRQSRRFLRGETPDRPFLSLFAIPTALLRLFQKFNSQVKILGVKNDDVSSIMRTH